MKRRTLLKALAVAPWIAPAAFAKDTGNVAVFGALPPPGKVARIFAAGHPASLIAFVLTPERLLGWPKPLARGARRFLPPDAPELPFLGRLSGRGSTVSIEALIQLKPDLILDVGQVDATYLSTARRVAEQTGIPYVLVDGRLPDSPRQLRDVARLIGVDDRGERLARHAEEALALADRLRRSVESERRPRVYYGRGVDGMETGMAGSINLEVIEYCGGSNVAAAAGKGGLTRVSPEQILAWDPEVILTQDPSFAGRAVTEPMWRSLPAVSAGRVHCAPSLPFGWLDDPPSVNRLIGVRWLLPKLYPGLASTTTHDDLRAATAEFFRLYYKTGLDKDRLDDLLGKAS